MSSTPDAELIVRMEPEKFPPDMIGSEPTGTLEVALRLRHSRLALKLTQARLSAITGIRANAWNNAEKGKNRLGLDSGIMLCQATGLTLDWIFRGVRSGLPVTIAEALLEIERNPPVKKPKRVRKHA
jgi:transcriptional regulator with XRE-family HTH domain